MAKPYKLTPIEHAPSQKEHFEDNLDKFINSEKIENEKKKNFPSKYPLMCRQ